MVQNLGMDHIEDLDAKHTLFKEAKDLARWEYKYLDNDEDMKGLVKLYRSVERTMCFMLVRRRRINMDISFLMLQCEAGDSREGTTQHFRR